MRNRLALQNCRKLDVCVQTNVPIRRTENDLHLPVSTQEPVVGQIGHEIWRIVEVTIVVVIPVEKLVNIEGTAHAHAIGHDVGMLQGEIHAMVSAEAAAGHSQLPRLVLPADKGQKFVQDVALVLQMAHQPHSRMHASVVPASYMHGLSAQHLNLAALDLRRESTNHAPVLILKELSHRG